MRELKGLSVSPGIGVGRAVRVVSPDLSFDPAAAGSPREEGERLDRATAALTGATQALIQAARREGGEDRAAILEGQLAMLTDPYFHSQTEEHLNAGESAEGAADRVCRGFMDLFAASGDPLLAQRAADVDDLRRRLLALLLGREGPDLSALPPDTVLVVEELTASMVSTLDSRHVAAVLAQAGGYTSHAAILCRSAGLPALFSVPGLLDAVAHGAMVAVDAGAGTALVEPGEDILADHRRRREEAALEQAELETFRGRETRTADGAAVNLSCNVGSAREGELAARAGAQGIGLLRTEFLFLDRPTLPDEEEQYRLFAQLAGQFPRGEVIVRTLDIGGDKPAPALDLPQEENPFLGNRAIRLCLSRPELLLPQLRALLRAAALGPVRAMVPFVTSVEELRQVRGLLSQAREELEKQGTVVGELPLGVMVETPAAAVMADVLAREVDFFSIGTNDLTQYTLCADRGNPAVAAIGSPFDPAVLRLVRHVIAAGHRAGIPVGMCGEAAAQSALIPLWLAFGLDEFSVNPASVLAARREIARWSMDRAKAVAGQAMEMESETQVREFLERTCERDQGPLK